MADLRTQIQTARGAGYNDDEIASFLSQRDPRVQQAIQSGYSAGEVLRFLETQQSAPAPATTETRVDPAVQAERDQGRLQILQAEREQIAQQAQAGDQSAVENLQVIDREIARATPRAATTTAPESAPPQGAVGGAFRGVRADMQPAQPQPQAPAAQQAERPWWTRGLIDLLQAPEGQTLSQAARNELLGLLRGAADIGSTLVEAARTTSAGGAAPIGTLPERFRERQQQITTGMGEMGAQVNAPGFTGMRTAGQIAGTLGAGPAVGAGLRAAGATRLGEAVAAGGFGPQGAGGLTGARGVGMRAAGGGVAGGAAAGLTEGTSEGAATGTAIGAVLPVVARPVGAVIKGLYDGIVKPFSQTKELSEDILADTLGKYLQEAPEAIARGGRAAATPGFERTLPETIEAGGGRATETLATLTERLQSASPALNQQIGNQIERRVGALQAQLARAQEQIKSQGSVLAPGAIEDLRRVQTQIQGELAKEQAALDVVRGAQFRTLPESMQEPGQMLSRVAKELQDELRSTTIRPAYKAAFDSAGVAKTNIDGVVAEAERILGRPLSSFAPETAPIVDDLLKYQKASQSGPQILGPDGRPIRQAATATLQELDDLRKAINKTIANAARGVGSLDPTTASNLKGLHASLDNAVQGSSTFSQETKDLYGKALANYREIYAPRFRQGPAFNILRPGRTAEQALIPTKVVDAFFNEDTADNFLRTFAGDARAFQAMRDGVLTKFRSTVAADGVISEAKAREFLTKNSAVLKKLDDAGVGIGPKLAEIEAESATMERALTKIKELGGGFDKTRTPQEMLDFMLSDQNRMGVAMKKASTIEKDAIRRVIATRLTNAIDSGNPAAALKMLTKEDGTLNAAYRVALGNDIADSFLSRAKAAVQIRDLSARPEMQSVRGIPPLLQKGKFTQAQLTALAPVIDDVERMKSIAELAERGAKVGEPTPGKIGRQEGVRQGAIRPLDVQFLNTTASIIRNTFTTLERKVEEKIANELAYMIWTNPQAARQAIENSLRRSAEAARPSRIGPAVPAAAGVIGADALQFE